MSLLDKQDDDHIDIDESKDYFDELTKPGGKFDRTKYSDETELKKAVGKSKYLADQQIEVMKRRMDEMREDFLKAQEELKTRASIEEMLDRVASNKPDNRDNNQQRDEDKKPVLDPNELESLFDKKLSMYEKQKVAEANRAQVESKLKERYGNNYKTVLAKQVDELGLSVEEMDSLAQRSPKAFFRTFGLDRTETESFDAPPRGGRQGFTPQTGEKRTWSYYKKMRQEKPHEYFSAKIHNQMLKDMEVLGKDFEDGDFNIYKQR